MKIAYIQFLLLHTSGLYYIRAASPKKDVTTERMTLSNQPQDYFCSNVYKSLPLLGQPQERASLRDENIHTF